MGPAIIIPLTKYPLILLQTSKLGYYVFNNSLLKLTQAVSTGQKILGQDPWMVVSVKRVIAWHNFLWISHRQRSLISNAEELPLSYHDVTITKFNRYRKQKNKTYKLGEKSWKQSHHLQRKLLKMCNKNWEKTDVNLKFKFCTV